jgi:hypothetical protein
MKGYTWPIREMKVNGPLLVFVYLTTDRFTQSAVWKGVIPIGSGGNTCDLYSGGEGSYPRQNTTYLDWDFPCFT